MFQEISTGSPTNEQRTSNVNSNPNINLKEYSSLESCFEKQQNVQLVKLHKLSHQLDKLEDSDDPVPKLTNKKKKSTKNVIRLKDALQTYFNRPVDRDIMSVLKDLPKSFTSI